MSNSEVHFRPYRPSDLEALYGLDELCFDKRFSFSREEMRRQAESKRASTIIAEVDQCLVGFAIFRLEAAASSRWAYVTTIDVHPKLRGQGIARQLMDRGEKEMRNLHCSYVWLHVFAENSPAIGLYEDGGYRLLRMEEHFYGRGLSALVYGKALQLEMMQGEQARHTDSNLKEN